MNQNCFFDLSMKNERKLFSRRPSRSFSIVVFIVLFLCLTSCSKKEGPVLADRNTEPIVPEGKPKNEAYPYNNSVEFSGLPEDLYWVNTNGPIRMEDLKGKFVILDFWTSCCINCFQIQSALQELQEKYADNLVIVGIHTGKFPREKSNSSIWDAIEKYGINYPVANDSDHRFSERMNVLFWPSLFLIAPDGNLVLICRNEVDMEFIDEFIQNGKPYFAKKNLLDTSPLQLKVMSPDGVHDPLRFPGKVLADASSKRVFVADTGHNRIVICDLDGNLIDIVGSGNAGRNDGDFKSATFNFPNGMVLHKQMLYVADTRNHSIREIDLEKKVVSTVAGTGKKAEIPFPDQDGFQRWRGAPLKTNLKSPWDLSLHNGKLYIAMAGSHQIWRMPLSREWIAPFAGNGREDIVNGNFLPDEPYGLNAASFAQPMGISIGAEIMFVADAEASSIRTLPMFDVGKVNTIIGTDHLPQGRLFSFGDAVGGYGVAKMQHPMDVLYYVDRVFVADSYNHRIKVITTLDGSIKSDTCRLEEFVGTGTEGLSNEINNVQFNEPSGLSIAADTLFVADTNNHVIRTVDIYSRLTKTFEIKGLKPPQIKQSQRPSFAKAAVYTLGAVKVSSESPNINLQVRLELDPEWKFNEIAPTGYYLDLLDASGNSVSMGPFIEIGQPANEFDVAAEINAASIKMVRLSLIYYTCREGGEGVCRIGNVVWNVPVENSSQTEKQDGSVASVVLLHSQK